MQCASHISEVNAKLPQGAKFNILPHLPWWDHHLFTNCWGTPPPLTCHLDQSGEYNLKLKPAKCNFFSDEITYIAHWVSKDGFTPVKAITECTLPQTYSEVCAFLSPVGQYRRFIKGFEWITQPLSKYLTGERASRKSVQVSLTEGAMKAFEALKQAYMMAPILAFAGYTKPFLLETNASKGELGVVLSQKQADRWYHPIAYGSRALMPHEKNCHSTKLEFFMLKWAVTEHFKEYLPYQ